MINLIECWLLISFGLLFMLILFTSLSTYQVKGSTRTYPGLIYESLSQK